MSRAKEEGDAERAHTFKNTTIHNHSHLGNTYSTCLVHDQPDRRPRDPQGHQAHASGSETVPLTCRGLSATRIGYGYMEVRERDRRCSQLLHRRARAAHAGKHKFRAAELLLHALEGEAE